MEISNDQLFVCWKLVPFCWKRERYGCSYTIAALGCSFFHGTSLLIYYELWGVRLWGYVYVYLIVSVLFRPFGLIIPLRSNIIDWFSFHPKCNNRRKSGFPLYSDRNVRLKQLNGIVNLFILATSFRKTQFTRSRWISTNRIFIVWYCAPAMSWGGFYFFSCPHKFMCGQNSYCQKSLARPGPSYYCDQKFPANVTNRQTTSNICSQKQANFQYQPRFPFLVSRTH